MVLLRKLSVYTSNGRIYTQHTYEGNVILKPVTGKAWVISIHISNLGRRSSMSNKTGIQWVLAGSCRKWRYPRRHCPLRRVNCWTDACHHGIRVPWVPIRRSVTAHAASCMGFHTSISWERIVPQLLVRALHWGLVMAMITMSSHSCGEGNDKLQGQHLSYNSERLCVIERECKRRKLIR